MRISTSMIFNSGVNTINSKTASLLHTQQQVSLGRRMVTAADDPVAAARALELQQSQNVNTQQATNLGNTKTSLGLEESQLSGVNELLVRVRQLVVQAGNSILSVADRHAITMELRSRYDDLLGLANAADGAGNYLFSGYMGNTIPFGGTVDTLNQAVGNEITYNGDSGQRTLQVSATRMLAISDPGDDVFKRIPNGNGHFSTSYAPSNTGSGVIGAVGSVIDPALWNGSTVKNVSVVFSVDSSATPPKTYYDLVDTTNGSPAPSLLVAAKTYALPLGAGSAQALPAAGYPGQLRPYTDGQPISLKSAAGDATPFDLGSSLTITGAPAQGDSFSLAPSTSQSVFKTIANAIQVLESAYTTTPAGTAALANGVGFALANLDQATENILKVRADIGSRLNEVDSLSNVNQDVNLQYQQTLSNLQDLDYAKSISDLTRQQNDLTAAQKSFASVSQLSLFNYIS